MSIPISIDAISTETSTSTHPKVARRADDVLLKLLDAIERDLAADKPIGPYVEAYEALSRAEAVRRPAN